MGQRFPRRFRVYSPCCTSANFSRWLGPDLHAVSSEFPPSLHDDNAPLPCPVATPASSAVVLDKEALGAIPSAPLPTSADGSDPGLYAASSELPPSLHDDSVPHPSPTATHALSAVAFDRAALGAIPAALPPTSADGSDLGLHAVFSEFPPSLHDDSAPLPSSVATLPPSTGVLGKAALRAIPPALPVHKDSVACQMDSGPQAPSAVPQSASRVAGNNRAQVPVVPAGPRRDETRRKKGWQGRLRR